MAGLLFTLPRQVVLDDSGDPVPGAKVNFYLAGTTTPQDTYTTKALSVAHDNPVVADAAGELDAIFLDSTKAYRCIVTDSSDVTLYDEDNINDVSLRAPYYDITAAENTAGVTPSDYSYPSGDVLRYGAAIDGVTNDYAALAAAVSVCATHPLLPWSGDLEIGTDTAISIPTGGRIGGMGPKSVISKASGTADIFTTTGNDIRVRGLRLIGPNNTGCDGITTDGGADIFIEDIEGYQLASTVTIGLTTATDGVTLRSIYSEDNAQQGTHLNKATNFYVEDIRSTGCGTTALHHGLYVGNCSDGTIVSPRCWSNAGFGLHIYAQSSYASRRITVIDPKCWSNGTAGSGNRAGIFVGRDSTSTSKGMVLVSPVTYNNVTAGIWVTNADELSIVSPDEDGNGDTTTNGIYIESGAGTAATTNVRIVGGRTIEHGSNVRIVAPASTTVNVWLDALRIADADAGGAVGIFANGAGNANVYVGESVVFSNNTTNMTHTASGGSLVNRIRSSGATSVADGGTVTHGHPKTPTNVRVTPSTASEFVSVTAIGATTFTVAIKTHDNSAGTTQTVYWEVAG